LILKSYIALTNNDKEISNIVGETELTNTNKDKLLKYAVIGKIVPPVVENRYVITWNGKPKIGLGRGGINYNVKVGDSCFGFDSSEKAEPGVATDGIGSDSEKNGYRYYTCVGNQAVVVSGENKNAIGTVVGKLGYLPGRAQHTLISFSETNLENLAIEDKIQVKAFGTGLLINGFEDIRVISASPTLVENLCSIEKEVVIVPVTNIIPAFMLGMGSGGSPPEGGNWEIQTSCPRDVLKELKIDKLRIGDVVALEDILSAYGRGYFKGGVTIGIISTGASDVAGQGIAVTTIMTTKNGTIKPKIDPDSNKQ
jgi:hypothetical protein